MPRLASAAALVAVLFSSPGAAVAGGPALDRLEPALPPDRFFGVQSPEAEGHGRLRLLALGEYQRDPLVLYRIEDGSPGERAGAVVSDQLRLHAIASVALWNRLALSLDFPFVAVNAGEAVGTVDAPSGAAVGDVRVGARGRVLGIGPLQIAIAACAWLPSGAEDDFAGAGGVRGEPSLVIGGRAGRWAYALDVGVQFAPRVEIARTEIGDELTFGLGVAHLFVGDRLSVGLESIGSAVLEGVDAFKGRTTQIEVLAGAKYRIGPVVLGAAFGPGLSRGVGTPAVRAVLSGAWVPLPEDRDRDRIVDDEDACPTVPGTYRPDPRTSGCPDPPPPDADGDGVPDPIDACPAVAGLFTGGPGSGCPDGDGDGVLDPVDACPAQRGPRTDDPRTSGCLPDSDRDGIADGEDACPDAPGVDSPDRRRRGCPPDRDRDGVSDANDACPDRRGVPSSNPNELGCPPDTDGDSFRNDEDACPSLAGLPSDDRTKRGCPKAFVRGNRVETHTPIELDDRTQAVTPAGIETLEAVAAVLRERKDLEGITIDVHSDDRGRRAVLVDRTQRRADAIKRWLKKQKGLERLRIEAKGHGPDEPIADNATEEGRAKNRRVEIRLLVPKKQVPRIPLPKKPAPASPDGAPPPPPT